MGDVVGHLAHRAQQAVDLRQHAVEVLRQPIELASAAAQRDATAEVAVHDIGRGAVERLDAAFGPACHHRPATGAKHKGREDGPDDGIFYQVLERQPLAQVTADEEPDPVG